MAIVRKGEKRHHHAGGVILPRGLVLALLAVKLSSPCRAAVPSEAQWPRRSPCDRQMTAFAACSSRQRSAYVPNVVDHILSVPALRSHLKRVSQVSYLLAKYAHMSAFESGKAWEGFKVVSKFIGRKAGVQGLLAGMFLSAVLGVRLAPAGTFSLYHTVGEIPASAFAERTVLAAQVVKVADGDTMRARHTPTFSLGRDMGSGRLSDETLLVRLAGVDAPEVAKQGEPGQPFSEEAKEYVKKRVLNQKVRVKLLRKDQYARAVARVEYGTWPLRHDLSEDLLREGLAVVYRQGGAEYDGRLQRFEELEAQAKKARRGLWSAGKRLETPAQFKAKKRAAERLQQQQGQGQQQKEPVYAAPRFRTQ